MAIDWNEENVAHLLRRAGFGASREAIGLAVAAGREATIDSLLTPDPTSDALPFPDPTTGQLQGWWVHRMVTTTSPLVEKLVLFFHDHFATAVSKVKKKPLMHRQNQVLRTHVFGRFRDLLRAMVRDPALLIFLDNQLNVKKSPNENFARELQELFTTGAVGANGQANYTEADVSECARAFTGYTVKQGSFVYDASQHDAGTKSFHGVTAKFDGEMIADLLAEEPATARRLVRKLWSYFAAPIGLKDPIAVELAGVYLASDTSLRSVLGAIFRHDAFYSDAAKLGAVRSPAEFLVVALRGLGATLTSIPTKWPKLGTAVANMGQALFEPPSVFGWPGGNAWVELSGLNRRIVAAEWIADQRAKSAKALFAYDPGALLGPEEEWATLDAAGVVQRVLDALGPLVVRPSTRQVLIEYATNWTTEVFVDADFVDRKVRGLIALALSSAEYQFANGTEGSAS